MIRPALISRRRNGRYESVEESHRQRTFKYMLPLRGESEVQVCKITFCNTFGVTLRRVQIIAEKVVHGVIDVRDRRGGSRPKKNSEWKSKIVDHISSFPIVESHYSRRDNPNKKYLSSDLSVAAVYKSFIELHELRDVKPCPVSRQWYYKVFTENFNLSFGQPRTDTCGVCDRLKIKIDEADNENEKQNARKDQELHHRRAEMGHSSMKSDHDLSKTNGVLVMSFDMQQQLFLPQLTHSQMFYSRQFGVWNFGVHIENNDLGIMNLWPETRGGRGSTEVASCLYNILTTHIIQDVVSPLPRKLILWSDNCAAQNKNQYVICMYMVLIAKGYFDEIVHKFPTCGHTFLSCDRDFALIEKKKRKSYPQIPRDIVNLITSTKDVNPFMVVDTLEFMDWKSLALETLSMTKFKISQVSEIHISGQRFGYLGAKLGHAGTTPWVYTNVLKPGVTKAFFETYNVVPVNNNKDLTSEKKTDIMAMMPFLRQTAREFYKNVLATAVADV